MAIICLYSHIPEKQLDPATKRRALEKVRQGLNPLAPVAVLRLVRTGGHLSRWHWAEARYC